MRSHLARPLAAFLLAAILAAAGAGARPSQAAPGAPLTNGKALCRYGVDAGSDIAGYPVNDLGAGWYVDWQGDASPARPGGISYMPTIRLKQTAAGGYTALSGAALAAAVQGNPGATWLIGNEPDRRYFQDDIEPQIYARAYHDLYHQIKALDPMARIAAGNIVQPTPVRLQYLDLILNAYRELYGASMPVDVWAIHAYPLNERSCTAFPENCWGADIPPGVNATEGMVISIAQTVDLNLFKQLIAQMRAWMRDRGYQERPLYITEMGVLMPTDYISPAQARTFMQGTFDYVATATGPAGQTADGGRLVQRWAWYALSDTTFNGGLYTPGSPPVRTSFGDYFASVTAGIQPAINLTQVQIWAGGFQRSTHGEPVTMTLYAEVTNDGNAALTTPFTVRFYLGPPAQGVQIGADQVVSGLDGCQTTTRVQVTWSGLQPGASATIYVVVDPENRISETNKSDNSANVTVKAPTRFVQLPLVTLHSIR